MDKLELLKCPCCGKFPAYYPQQIYIQGIGGYRCHCTRYACDFPYSVMANDKAGVIKAWNEAVNKYKREANG